MSSLTTLTPPPGLRVLITAGASGIGKAIADDFAAAGASVHISDINADAVAAACTDRIGGTVADASDEAATRRLVDEARARLGGLDVIVANAGIEGPTAGIGDIAAEDWDRTMEITCAGPILRRVSRPTT